MRAQASRRVNQHALAFLRAPASREGKRRHKRRQQRNESSNDQNERREEHFAMYSRGSRERHTLISARSTISVMSAGASAPERFTPFGNVR